MTGLVVVRVDRVGCGSRWHCFVDSRKRFSIAILVLTFRFRKSKISMLEFYFIVMSVRLNSLGPTSFIPISLNTSTLFCFSK